MTTQQPKQVNVGLELKQGPNGGGLVTKVDKFSSCGKAGVLAGDEVMTWNGTAPASEEAWLKWVAGLKVGEVMTLGVIRQGKRIEVKVPLVEKRKTLSLDLEELDEVLERKISPAN